MFAIAGFSHNTVMDPNASPGMQELAEGLADIFLNGVLSKISGLLCTEWVDFPADALRTRRQKLAQLIDTPWLWSGRSSPRNFPAIPSPSRQQSLPLLCWATLRERCDSPRSWSVNSVHG